MRLSDLVFNESKEHEFSIPLYRGLKRPVGEDGIIPFSFRSATLDTPIVFHNYVNEKTIRLFGLPLRNLIFATPSKDSASEYGSFIYQVSPVGEYRCFSSTDYSDFTVDLGLMPNRIKKRFMDLLASKFNITISVTDELKISRTKIKSLSSWDDFEKYFISLYDTLNLNDDIDISKFKSMIESIINDYIRSLDVYIGSIIEITEPSKIQQLKDDAEIMIYSPDGLKYQ